MKRTKIVATIGPASHSKEIIGAMIAAGMNVARLNFSHGTHEDHAELIRTIRATAAATNSSVAIMQDVQGPKIRLGVLPDEGVVLNAKETVIFDTAIGTYDGTNLPIDFSELHTYVRTGERILLSDGTIETTIVSVTGTTIVAEVTVGGHISSHKGINVPDTKLTLAALTEKDKTDIAFGVEHDVDFLAVSFVRSAEDILDAKFTLQEAEKQLHKQPTAPIRIIAKIERPDAVDHIDEILDVADGIMVARGDLGIEIPAAKVPLVQKTLIEKAMVQAKPVIVATQMLDSMQHNPRPTRAEVSDVANAVIDHADAVMLSNETATGTYPVQAVETMRSIILETEASKFDDVAIQNLVDEVHPIDEVMTNLSRTLSEDIGATLILAASLSGETGRLISRNRPELPIAVTVNDERVQRQLMLSWGVIPLMLGECRSIEELVERSLVILKREHLVAERDKIVIVAGEPVGHAGHVNLLEVREVA
jgi:pyruvate kinase